MLTIHLTELNDLIVLISNKNEFFKIKIDKYWIKFKLIKVGVDLFINDITIKINW